MFRRKQQSVLSQTDDKHPPSVRFVLFFSEATDRTTVWILNDYYRSGKQTKANSICETDENGMLSASANQT
jgi:hypothetical protein